MLSTHNGRMDALAQHLLRSAQQRTCENHDGRGTVTCFDVLGSRQVNELLREELSGRYLSARASGPRKPTLSYACSL